VSDPAARWRDHLRLRLLSSVPFETVSLIGQKHVRQYFFVRWPGFQTQIRFLDANDGRQSYLECGDLSDLSPLSTGDLSPSESWSACEPLKGGSAGPTSRPTAKAVTSLTSHRTPKGFALSDEGIKAWPANPDIS